MAKRSAAPKWATPDDTNEKKTRAVPIRLSDAEIARADKLATATHQSRSALLKRIVVDALESPDAQDVLARR